jgi:hypothetical protein
MPKKPKPPKENLPWRHAANCQICRHPHRAEIEKMFLEWQPMNQICKEYGLGSRKTIWRHSRALDLFSQRNSNVRATFCQIIERGMSRGMKVSPSMVIAAAIALSKLDAEGKTLERFEQVNRHANFLGDARWTQGEMLRYAETGELPPWLEAEQTSGTPDRAFEDSSAPN